MATTKLNLTPIGRTCGKQRFYKQSEAENIMGCLVESEKINGKRHGELNVYVCPVCRCWHVGHANS